MLIVETIGRIRREHLVKGKSIREIARDLKVSRNTVRKVLRSGETSFSYGREVQARPKLGRWREELDRLLAQNAGAAGRERLTLIRLFEELRALGYDGGGYGVCRQGTAIQPPLSADVRASSGRSGRLHTGLGLGEGPSGEPGRLGARALLHATCG